MRSVYFRRLSIKKVGGRGWGGGGMGGGGKRGIFDSCRALPGRRGRLNEFFCDGIILARSDGS